MTAPSVGSLSGDRLREMFTVAAAHLEDLAAAINAINVYPVPDGDTGSNMSATMREAVRLAASTGAGAPAGDVLAAIARGALYGARGNSGVILSQALKGLAEPTAGCAVLDAGALPEALAAAASRAYAAVAEPREGTMLTVLRAAATAAADTHEQSPGAPLPDILHAAVAAAEIAEAKTIDQLPQLREAGVTDSGGEGICVLLRGLRAALLGVELPRTANVPSVPPDLHALAREGYGHCTEFLVGRVESALDADAIRNWLADAQLQSVVVVGDPEMVRVHVHAVDPNPVIEGAGQFGRVHRIKVDDMDVQAGRFFTAGSGATAKIALLALSPGEGFDAVFTSLGARVMRLEIVKPAAGAIARAADALRVPDVVLLPDHENVVWAARQAAEIATCSLHVVPAVTVPQGIAAALVFDADAPVGELIDEMTAALGTAHTVEVTCAAASRTVEGVAIRQGQWIALVDTRMAAAADGEIEALVLGLGRADAAAAELITVYPGEGYDEAADAVRAAIAAAFPAATIEILAGRQPLYAFIASVE